MGYRVKLVGGVCHGRVMEIADRMDHLVAADAEEMWEAARREVYTYCPGFSGPTGELLYIAKDVKKYGLKVPTRVFGDVYSLIEAYERLTEELPKFPPLSQIRTERYPEAIHFTWLART